MPHLDSDFSGSGRAISHLMFYAATHKEEVDPEARRLAQILKMYYPAGLEMPVVAALFGLAVAACVSLKEVST